jgi:uncharacterized protein YxjI
MVRDRFTRVINGPACMISKRWTVTERVHTFEVEGIAGVEGDGHLFVFSYRSDKRYVPRLKT